MNGGEMTARRSFRSRQTKWQLDAGRDNKRKAWRNGSSTPFRSRHFQTQVETGPSSSRGASGGGASKLQLDVFSGRDTVMRRTIRRTIRLSKWQLDALQVETSLATRATITDGRSKWQLDALSVETQGSRTSDGSKMTARRSSGRDTWCSVLTRSVRSGRNDSSTPFAGRDVASVSKNAAARSEGEAPHPP